MNPESCPLFEHDFESAAQIEPSRLITLRDIPEHCVISFFREVNAQVISDHAATVVANHRWEDGEHPIYALNHQGRRVAFFHPGVGAPIAAGQLETAIAYGCKKFVVIGGAGILEKDVAVGHLILLDRAVRDEGLSYHYVPPAREIAAHPHAVAVLQATLQARGVPFVVGKTWTTDAPFRETPAIIARRRTEGCLTVEMEAASLMAVAQFRQVTLGQIVYAGDDLSGEEWDNRGWQSRNDVRHSLFWLAVEACLGL